jgi:hypothetical protein
MTVRSTIGTIASVVLLAASSHPAGQTQPGDAGDRIVRMLGEEKPYHAIDAAAFEELGWPLPDGGSSVKALADAAPGGAFDPRALEAVAADRLGYTAKWHSVRYKVYGLDWDITGLQLTPRSPLPGLPTIAIINGGSANWYEFFLDPLNRAGLGQYLGQRVPVLLVTIPGNYRHGGWTETSFDRRIPGYLLDRDVSPAEARIRHSIYTFRVVTDGVQRLLESATTGPVVIVGHSTGGEVQFILNQSSLKARLKGLSLGWGTGGPASMSAMGAYRGTRTADDYPHIADLNPRPPSAYARGYLGPLNPFWDPAQSRLEMATRWMAREERRRPQFKQTLQNIEHNSADNLRDHVTRQLRDVLRGNTLGIAPDEVIGDLFTTMRAPLTGYQRMIWTVARLDDGHWNEDVAKARELQVANEFRRSNPGVPIRVLLFDLPMTHYGHIEKPRQLAGGLVAALTWLTR